MPKFGAQIDTQGIPVKSLAAEGMTAFPATPFEGQLVHRTDLKQYYIYLNAGWVRCDNQGVAAAVHVHAIADVTGLQALLDAKAALAHAHAIGDITGLTAALAAKLDQTQVDARISSILDIANAPTTLDTLNELAAALGDDPNFATTITNALAGKAAINHTHALTGSDLTGTLPITKGGTGATTAAAARTALGASGYFSANVAALAAGTWVTVTHNLNNSTPDVSFVEVSSTEQIVLDWKVSSANAIQVKSDIAFAANAIRVGING